MLFIHFQNVSTAKLIFKVFVVFYLWLKAKGLLSFIVIYILGRGGLEVFYLSIRIDPIFGCYMFIFPYGKAASAVNKSKFDRQVLELNGY